VHFWKLENLTAIIDVKGSTLLYPCDANQTAELVAEMADLPGISYLRTTRGKTPVIYDASERFPIGRSKTLFASDRDRIALIAAGITVHQALEAAEMLA
jgi:transketolase